MSVLEFEVINWSSEEWSFGTCQWRIRRCIRKQGVRILGIVVAEAVIIVLIVRKDASCTDDIYDHRA
jgi:hypothetical protein